MSDLLGTRYQGPFCDAAQRESGERAVPARLPDRTHDPQGHKDSL
ncbi:MAG: hypothetical protein ACXVB5_19320 [Isosphaeraceae bacterium]